MSCSAAAAACELSEQNSFIIEWNPVRYVIVDTGVESKMLT